MGESGSRPPGPLACPERGGARSGPGMRSESRPSLGIPNQEIKVACCLWGGYPVGPGIIQGVGGRFTPITLGHPMQDLPTGGQGTHCQFHVALGEADPLMKLLLVGVTLYCNTEALFL